MSNINTKDIKDFCSEEREGIILKQKIKIQALEKENEQLKKDNFSLSAGCCEHLIGDERGHETCKFREENKLLVEKLEKIKGFANKATFTTLINGEVHIGTYSAFDHDALVGIRKITDELEG